IAAVDRPRILKTLFGDLSPVAQGVLSAYPFAALLPAVSPAYSPEQANALLDQAGWIDSDGNGVRENGQNELALAVIAPPWGFNPEAAQLIKVDWEAVGARVNLEIAPAFGSLKQSQEQGLYHAIGLNFFGTDADLLRTFYRSDGIYNWSQFQSVALDRLLDQASTETDAAMRNQLYLQAIQSIADQALTLPIRDYVNIMIHRQTLSNLHFSAQGWFPYLIDLKLAS
ncbi:MAG: ABC transporter substrate-binding protein, partial [Anaerolineales bacterium]|nr:ABC transporter substrate-binding protein [Anaerolineales bacterium]